jgi:hypothetical protein
MTINNEFPSEEYIYTYSRKEAVDDGLQVDVSKLASETGIRVPVFLTRAVYDQCVTVPEGVTGQDEIGRQWDILVILRLAVQAGYPDSRRLRFTLSVNNGGIKPEMITLMAVCGPLDADAPQRVITVMLPDED